MEYREYWIVELEEDETERKFTVATSDDPSSALFTCFFEATRAAEKLIDGRMVVHHWADYPGVSLTLKDGDSISISLVDTNLDLKAIVPGWSTP